MEKIPKFDKVKPDTVYELPETYVAGTLELIITDECNGTKIHVDHLVKDNSIYIPRMSSNVELILSYLYEVDAKKVVCEADDWKPVFIIEPENIFPKTTRAIRMVSKALDVVSKLGLDEKITPHDDYYTTNIGLHIAQALWMDHEDIAKDIAKYICIMGDIDGFNVDVDYK